MIKAFKFDLEVKGQHRIAIMNVRDIVLWWYTHVPNRVSQCQSKNKLWTDQESLSKPLWPLGQSSRSYLDHECTRHIVLLWYFHWPNMVSRCQTKEKLWAGQKSAPSFLLTPMNFQEPKIHELSGGFSTLNAKTHWGPSPPPADPSRLFCVRSKMIQYRKWTKSF